MYYTRCIHAYDFGVLYVFVLYMFVLYTHAVVNGPEIFSKYEQKRPTMEQKRPPIEPTRPHIRIYYIHIIHYTTYILYYIHIIHSYIHLHIRSSMGPKYSPSTWVGARRISATCLLMPRPTCWCVCAKETYCRAKETYYRGTYPQPVC